MINPARLWYSHDPVLFEIVKHCKNKELMIKQENIVVRWLRAAHIKILSKILKHFRVLNIPTTMYASLTNYDYIPMMSFNLAERSLQSKKWLEEGLRKNHARSIDFGIDLDSKEGTYKDVYEEVDKIIGLYDKIGIKYAFWATTHGFHIVIPASEVLPSFDYFPTEQELVSIYEEIIILMRKKLGLKHLDESVYNVARVFRTPYSVDKNYQVIFPLDNNSYEALKKEELLLNPLYILRHYVIKNRGVYINGNSRYRAFEELIRELENRK